MRFLSGLYDGLSMERVYSAIRAYSVILVGDDQVKEPIHQYSHQIYYITQQNNAETNTNINSNNSAIVITSNQLSYCSSFCKDHFPSHQILLAASILCQECVKVGAMKATSGVVFSEFHFVSIDFDSRFSSDDGFAFLFQSINQTIKQTNKQK